jgi:lysyl-tRNA synthetase class 1
MYDFVRVKGTGGKISSSAGGVVTLHDCMRVYEPEMIRWLFAGTRANAEFAISFDTDVIKLYEDFDRCERIYFGHESVDEKEKTKQARIYELSCVEEVPETLPFQPSFRHLTNVLQVFSLDIEKTSSYYKEHYADQMKTEHDKHRLIRRAECAKNWLSEFAPEQFTFQIQTTVDAETVAELAENQRQALRDVRVALLEKEWNDKELHEYFYTIIEKNGLSVKDFFKACYTVLIGKTKGPQLASFILTIGQDRVAELLKEI